MNALFRFHLFYAFAFVGALAACSSDGDGSSSGGSATASGYAKSYCELMQPCCVQAGFKGDMTMCGLFAGGQAGYDAAAGERCLSTMRERAKDGTLCSNMPPCNDVFRGGGGSAKPGEACSKDADCASVEGGVVRCQGSGAEAYCQVSRPGKEGDSPCVASVVGPITTHVPGETAEGFVCADTDGLTCDWTTKACRRFAGDGESCAGMGDCAAGLWCGSTGLCQRRAAAGTPCMDGYDDSCAEGHKCEGSLCVPRALIGEACGSSRDCESGNCEGGTCKPAFDLGYALLCGGT